MASARKKEGSKGGHASDDPATSERYYEPDEVEFMLAMDKYKRENNRPFPTWSAVLGVLKSLGYSKQGKA